MTGLKYKTFYNCPRSPLYTTLTSRIMFTPIAGCSERKTKLGLPENHIITVHFQINLAAERIPRQHTDKSTWRKTNADDRNKTIQSLAMSGIGNGG